MTEATPRNPIGFSLPGAVARIRLATAPASDWMGTIRNLRGIPADEAEWFDLSSWLGSLGDRQVSKPDLLARIEHLTPGIRLVEVPPEEWRHEGSVPASLVPHRDGYRELLALLERNPRASGAFQDHHWDDAPVLFHLRFVRRQGMLHLLELQSEWHQRGARGPRVPDVTAHREAIEDRRRAAEAEIQRLMATGQGAEFVRAVAGTLRWPRQPPGEAASAAPRIAWSALNGNDCGEAIEGVCREWRPHLGPLLGAFSRRWDACREGMEALSAVPLAPMRLSWPRAGIRLALAISAAEGLAGVSLPDGVDVAEALEVDEPLASLSWRTLGDGRIELAPVTVDVNASRKERPPEAAGRGDLGGLLGDEETATEVLSRLEEGEAGGILDGDWFWDRPEVIWVNRGLRRFYDRHLPRLLAEEGRRAGATVTTGGMAALHSDASRSTWSVPPITRWETRAANVEATPAP